MIRVSLWRQGIRCGISMEPESKYFHLHHAALGVLIIDQHQVLWRLLIGLSVLAWHLYTSIKSI